MNALDRSEDFAGASQRESPSEEERRSDRVSVSLPLEIFGTDLTGEDFTEKGHTKVLSRHGAAIVMKRALGPEQILTIKRAGGRAEAEARVIGQVSTESEGHVYGIALLDPAQDFWGIAFPPVEECRNAFVRVLLECTGCRTREVAPLNEIEFMVFEANDSLQRDCRKCREHSVWKMALLEGPPEPEGVAQSEPQPTSPALREVELQPPTEKMPGVQSAEKKTAAADRRKHARIKVGLRGCILLSRPDEKEIIEVLDMSRSGIRFISSRKFVDNQWVQVAVPYTEGTGNIFQAARIVWRRTLEKKGFEYGLKYVKF